jgi:hypothetical protein
MIDEKDGGKVFSEIGALFSLTHFVSTGSLSTRGRGQAVDKNWDDPGKQCACNTYVDFENIPSTLVKFVPAAGRTNGPMCGEDVFRHV